MYIFMFKHIPTYLPTYLPTPTYMHVYTYIHTYIHAYLQKDIYVYKKSRYMYTDSFNIERNVPVCIYDMNYTNYTYDMGCRIYP